MLVVGDPSFMIYRNTADPIVRGKFVLLDRNGVHQASAWVQPTSLFDARKLASVELVGIFIII